MENRWRFKGNGFGTDNGLDTSDMETFKKDAFTSLAREICQNSIDARDVSDKPVRIEFKTFEVQRESIPGVEDITEQIEACIKTWPNNKKLSDQLKDMYSHANAKKITCLRISDFNTTGLCGASTQEDDTAWHYLIHGSGLSNKAQSSGGSKGIGKFATFVTSYFNTVFYSTKTINNEIGYEGICKLCSAKMIDSNEKTQGIGYYGSSEENQPVFEELNLDSTFVRNDKEYGTDIYIIGFKTLDKWKEDIISKTLDSFMCAIMFSQLEVVVDDVIINASTVKNIVYGDQIKKSFKKNVVSQYLLLTDTEHRFEDTIHTDLGDVKLYLLGFNKEDKDIATNSCVMIRYPYMKIRDIANISAIPCSAMCIIEEGNLQRQLRDVENPQHTDWEFNRIDDASTRAELKGIYKQLKSDIVSTISEHLIKSDDTITDLEGAAEFLPGGEGERKSDKEQKKTKILDKPQLKTKVKQKKFNANASVIDESGDGVEMDIGVFDDNGSDTLAPNGTNDGTKGPFKLGSEEKDGIPNDEGHIIAKPANLRGMSYKFFCMNKKDRKYVVTFISDYDEDEATLVLYALDDSDGKEQVQISECLLNKEPVQVVNNTIQMQLKHGQRYTLEMITNQIELFSAEVKVYVNK